MLPLIVLLFCVCVLIQCVVVLTRPNSLSPSSSQKYLIVAFALLILLAVVALIVGLSVGLIKRPA